MKAYSTLLLLSCLSACASRGYTSAGVIYSEPADYMYVVPVDRVVVVSREVLVSRGWSVYRVERSGPERIIWARRGPDEVVRIFASPAGNRVAVRGLFEARDREDHGRHKGWKRRQAPRDILFDIDHRLRRTG